ncbi:MAG: hypothetical protein K2X44_01790 [Magnetospirillum sp.]|nr:hypothetical protein [Magnetospirillum sp.]
MAGRLPVDKVVTAGTVTGQDAVWIAVRALSGTQDTFAVVHVTSYLAAARRPRLSADKKTVADYLKRLDVAGVLQAQDDGYYRLPLDPGQKTPRVRRDGTVVEDVQTIFGGSSISFHGVGDGFIVVLSIRTA